MFFKMNLSDDCRLCNYCNFKVKFANLSQISHVLTEIFESTQKSKDCKGKILVQICQEFGLEVIKCEKYSSQVCSPSAQKIRILGSLYSFVKESLHGEVDKSTSTPLKSTPVKKHLLDTPDEKSPIRKSVQVFSTVRKTIRKC